MSNYELKEKNVFLWLLECGVLLFAGGFRLLIFNRVIFAAITILMKERENLISGDGFYCGFFNYRTWGNECFSTLMSALRRAV